MAHMHLWAGGRVCVSTRPFREDLDGWYLVVDRTCLMKDLPLRDSVGL